LSIFPFNYQDIWMYITYLSTIYLHMCVCSIHQ
jgi:hypothetical protein